MPFDPYAEFRPRRRLHRAVRIMVLACAAGLGGVVAGGAGVFALVSVLTAPPPHRPGEGAVSKAAVAAIPHTVAPAPTKDVATAATVARPAPPAPAEAGVSPTSSPAPQPAPPTKEVATTRAAPPAPSAANEQKTAKPANEKEVRAVDTRPMPADTDTRAIKPLYGYAPRYGEPQRRRGETTARDKQPSARDREDRRDRDDARDDANVRPGFSGRDEARREWSTDGMRQGFADSPDDAPPPGFRQLPPRNAERRGRSDRDQQVYFRYPRPQPRPGYDERGIGPMDGFIGNDEWVGDWRY